MITYQKDIDEWIYLIHGNHIEHCKDVELSLDNNVIPALNRPDVYIDADRIEKGLRLEKYFPFKLLPWERYQFAVIAGMFLRCPGAPYDDIYFHTIYDILGRGAGKNGFIDFLAFYFISPYHGVHGYNIDLIANGEEQAGTSIKDVGDIVRNPAPQYRRAIAANYRALVESVTGLKTNSIFRLNTTSTKNKDSKRTGCIVFDEKHQYSDLTNMNTLKSGFGKVQWWREITITTDGNLRGGVLDAEKESCEQILREWNPKNRTFVNWFRIEKENEWKDIKKIVKANPSIADPSFFSLKTTIEQEIQLMPTTPEYFTEFMAKRCNFPMGDREIEVASWDDIVACTKAPSFEIKPGMTCIGALDYSKTDDFVGCVAIFRNGDEYAIKHHSFICEKSPRLETIRAKVPIDEWEKQGICTIVHAVEISPDIVAEWFAETARTYNLVWIAIDDYRLSLMNHALNRVGFDAFSKTSKNIWIVKRMDVMRIAPTVISLFTRHAFSGFDRMLCWYTNNTKQVQQSGNILFDKIEPRLRKTDGFMAIVHGMTIADKLPETNTLPTITIGSYTY